ncbi:MAG: aminodeoxychorismate lyase [Gammaproteobacteria bacterium]
MNEHAAFSGPLAILVNGQPDPCVNASDRGLHYGDGLFETLAIVKGTLSYWDRHYSRLALGCERLGFPRPEERLLLKEAHGCSSGVQRGVLKLILTRGTGTRGYRAANSAMPTRIWVLYAWPEYPEHYWQRGITVRLCTTRLARNRSMAGVKHLNRLEQVLARSEWNDPAIAEGLMLDTSGFLTEGTMSNVFLVRGRKLFTPDLSVAGVCGIMRGVIIEAAKRLGIETRVKAMRLSELWCADHAFVCNSVVGIWPIAEVIARRKHLFEVGHLVREITLSHGTHFD